MTVGGVVTQLFSQLVLFNLASDVLTIGPEKFTLGLKILIRFRRLVWRSLHALVLRYDLPLGNFVIEVFNADLPHHILDLVFHGFADLPGKWRLICQFSHL